MIKVIGELQSNLHKVVVCESCNSVLSYHPLDIRKFYSNPKYPLLEFLDCPCCKTSILLNVTIRHN